MKVIKDLYKTKAWQPNNKNQLVEGLETLVSLVSGEEFAEVIPFDVENYDVQEIDLLDIFKDGVEIEVQQYTRIIFNDLEIHQQYLYLNQLKIEENRPTISKSFFMEHYYEINSAVSSLFEREFLHAVNKSEDYFSTDESIVHYNTWINELKNFNEEIEFFLYPFGSLLKE